jgi:hypothetical protein
MQVATGCRGSPYLVGCLEHKLRAAHAGYFLGIDLGKLPTACCLQYRGSAAQTAQRSGAPGSVEEEMRGQESHRAAGR